MALVKKTRTAAALLWGSALAVLGFLIVFFGPASRLPLSVQHALGGGIAHADTANTATSPGISCGSQGSGSDGSGAGGGCGGGGGGGGGGSAS